MGTSPNMRKGRTSPRLRRRKTPKILPLSPSDICRYISAPGFVTCSCRTPECEVATLEGYGLHGTGSISTPARTRFFVRHIGRTAVSTSRTKRSGRDDLKRGHLPPTIRVGVPNGSHPQTGWVFSFLRRLPPLERDDCPGHLPDSSYRRV